MLKFKIFLKILGKVLMDTKKYKNFTKYFCIFFSNSPAQIFFYVTVDPYINSYFSYSY